MAAELPGRFVDNSLDLAVVIDAQMRLVYVNPAARSQLGYDTESVIGAGALEFVHPDDRALAADRLAQALAGGTPGARVEVRLRHVDGRWIWFEIVAAMLDGGDADATAIISARNVDDRRALQREAARRVSFDRFALSVSRRALDVGIDGLGAMFGEVLRELCELIGTEQGAIEIFDGGTWRSLAQHPPGATGAATGTGSSRTVWHRRLAAGEPLLATARDADEDCTASLAVPMVARGTLVGVVSVERASPGRWHHDEAWLVRTIAETFASTWLREQARAQLEASEARLRLIADNASDLITLLDQDGRVLYASPASRTLLGLDPDELVGQLAPDFVHPEDLAAVSNRPPVDDDVDAATFALRLRRGDDSWVWTETVVRLVRDPHTARIAHIQASTRDITERKLLEEELRRQALHDPLTGLANRHLLLDRLDAAARRQSRTGEPYSVLLVDLDGFKYVNDVAGHHAGDQVLRVVAGRLQALVRETDTVARLGGDEFVVVCADAEAEQALAIAERVVSVLSEPIVHAEGAWQLGASVGVTTAQGPRTAEELLRAADRAMYEAKRAGKGRARLG